MHLRLWNATGPLARDCGPCSSFHRINNDDANSEKSFACSPQAAEVYRAAVRNLNTTLSEPQDRTQARALIGNLLGGRAKIRQEGDAVFYAQLKIDAAVLLSVAANSSKFRDVKRGSGGVLCTNSTVVVRFDNNDRRTLRQRHIPSCCGRGHSLTAENLRIDAGEGRWRCLECGRARAAAFRSRHRRGA